MFSELVTAESTIERDIPDCLTLSDRAGD